MSILARFGSIIEAAGADLWHQTVKSYKELSQGNYVTGYLFATPALFLIGKAVRHGGKKSNISAVETIGKIIEKLNAASLTKRALSSGVRYRPTKNLNAIPKWILDIRYNSEYGDLRLFQDAMEGKISGNKLRDLIQNGNLRWKSSKKGTKSISDFVQKMLGKSDTELSANIITLLIDNSDDIRFLKNKHFRDLIFRVESANAGFSDGFNHAIAGFRKKHYIPEKVKNLSDLEIFMSGEELNSSAYSALSDNHKKLFKHLMENGKFKKLEDLKHILDSIDQIPVDGVDAGKLFRLAQELSQNLDLFANRSRLSNFVQDSLKKPLQSATEAATEIAESIAESNTYKGLAQQFDSDLKILNNDLASASEAKKIQIQKQIDQLEHLKKNFAIGRTQAEIDQLFDFYKEYRKLVPNKSIANLDVIGKMLAKNLPELEEALKNFDLQKLKTLKQAGHFDDIGDEAFESVFKMLDKVKQMKNVNLLKYGDEFLDGIKTFVKILSKTT